MQNGIGIATRILLINSVIAVFAFVAQIASLVIYGPTHDYWPLYITLMLIMFAASLVAQWAVRKSLFAGMNFYAWICFACIVGMVCIDLSLIRVGFPLILFMLALGSMGLGLTVGYSASVPFAAVCCVMVLAIGVIGNCVDNAIMAMTLIGAASAMSSENARTTRRLDTLETAVDEYVDAKQRIRQDTVSYRSGSS